MNILFALTLIVFAIILFFPVVLHWVYRAPRLVETTTPASVSLAYSSQYIPTIRGKKLFSWLIENERSDKVVIMAHGWGGNAQMLLPLARPFHDNGMSVLLYDARNHGKSDADTFSSLPRFAEDMNSVIDWIRDYRDKAEVIILGHSIGAAAAMLTASKRTDIDLVIGVSGFAHPNLVMRRHLDRPWVPRFIVPIILHYVQWMIGYRFEDIAPMNRVKYIQCPVLLAHGTKDNVVPINDMRLIEQNASPDNDLHLFPIEGAGHGSVKKFQQHASVLIEYINQRFGSVKV